MIGCGRSNSDVTRVGVEDICPGRLPGSGPARAAQGIERVRCRGQRLARGERRAVDANLQPARLAVEGIGPELSAALSWTVNKPFATGTPFTVCVPIRLPPPRAS